LILRLEHYSTAELSQVLAQRARRLGWSVAEDVIAAIAVQGRGTPRIALRLLEATRRVARAEGADALTVAHFNRMTEIEGLDAIGLDQLEQRYLQVLRSSDGPVRLNILATRLGIARRTIETVVEGDVIRLGLISKDDDGRFLTPQGRQHLTQST
jgi:Holliday junction DNA helicase RuvB